MHQVGKGMAMLRAINGPTVARSVGGGLTRAMEMHASAVAGIHAMKSLNVGIVRDIDLNNKGLTPAPNSSPGPAA